MRKNKLSFIALSIASIFYSFHVTANENIIVDDKLKTDLTVEMKDGIEHIHIEKTNENGISHNYYQKFNVSKKGAVLENTNDLAAKIIVNEVTSAEKSLLRGKLTVNGKAAELIIANPNGIKCNGCWFAGSPTQRLVIGKVFYIEENSLNRFRDVGFNEVESGEILLATENGDIVFKGNSRVHRSGKGRLDLISRNIKILDNSSLSASRIYATIGDNILRVSHDNQLSVIGKSMPSTKTPATGLSIGADALIQAKYINIKLTDDSSINNR
ncbi:MULTISPECIES: filamentous hemagglutinin N-terminal domain-containing protein [unclassified Arsenophonus]|uniref:two-partner secretion domain-containing protein n=1 Tax=unclassified Arsenophonus TaxID=2627083 RepID=UPI00285A71FF|nr:filamentous hemagglutinin N-terminal domain-containing protein [Arsenophonus sp.]MDR5610362.1 filamentous hemagglutinin N-terminal domain-containing protein [Arsenophonus sp.]MDR5614135.1 filamentous hemagglutinin N-terminal domain-containing protein [Arsenophonus sp.]